MELDKHQPQKGYQLENNKCIITKSQGQLEELGLTANFQLHCNNKMANKEQLQMVLTEDKPQ